MPHWIDKNAFVSQISTELNAAMMLAAEPLIEKALEDIRIKMREELGKRLIGLVQNNMMVEVMGQHIVVTINQALEDRKALK